MVLNVLIRTLWLWLWFHKAYQGRGDGGRGYGGGRRGGLYTYRYTVTTRMTTALKWAAMGAILMFH